MDRLTEKDVCGNWSLKGLPWKDLYEGTPITRETYEILYGALCKLLDYEETGCLLYTSPSPRDLSTSRMPSSA